MTAVRVCPFCGAEVDDEAWCEIAHMSNVHPEIVACRQRDAGMHPDVIEGPALDDALDRLQLEIAKLAIFLPDLPERHKRLIDRVLLAIHEWEATR